MKQFARMLALHVVETPFKNLVKSGNVKVPSDTAIFNMSSATNCPSRKLGLCKAISNGKIICYAMKAERSYRPNVLPYRESQNVFWKETTAEMLATQFILLNVMKPIPFNALRLNESGDFHSQECVEKAEKIARILKKHGVIIYCYTSRDDLDFSSVKALRVSGSGFKKKGITNIFKMIEKKEDRPIGYGICIGNCRKCTRCLQTGMKTCVIKH